MIAISLPIFEAVHFGCKLVTYTNIMPEGNFLQKCCYQVIFVLILINLISSKDLDEFLITY